MKEEAKKILEYPAYKWSSKLDRSWWEGCETCKGGRYRCGECCPSCGRPLIEAACTDLERRIT